MKAPSARVTVDRVIRGLLIANAVLFAGLLAVVIISSFRSTPGVPAQLEPTPSPSSDTIPMGIAHIPTTNSCLLCHETGGEGGLKPIPALGHPLEGWRSCTVCHTDESIARTAPGHDGIPEDQCLNCHKVAVEGPAITQPHLEIQDKHCLDCHGSYAHLPTSMVDRDEDECWLCHKPTAYPPPNPPHEHEPTLECRTCHQSAQVGGLPIDHALRADDTCLLCHDIKIAEGGPDLLPSPTPAPSPSP
jgi:hypothetical protein